MSTPHAKLRKEIADWLTAQGAWVHTAHMSGFGRKGIPDLLCCWRGRFLAIEVKVGRDTPTPWQGRELAAVHTRCLNLGDMGVGKSLAALWAADYLMQLGLVKRALILSPLSTLNRVWGDEIFTHLLARRSFQILYGAAAGRIEKLETAADF